MIVANERNEDIKYYLTVDELYDVINAAQKQKKILTGNYMNFETEISLRTAATKHSIESVKDL